VVQTTCIGAWPKPVSLGGGDWQEIEADATESDAQGFSYTAGAARKFSEAVLDNATAEAVQDQVACGIDVPTDGEMRRENYIHYHCRHLIGIDFDLLTSKVHRNGAAIASLPTITSEVRPKGDHFLDRDFAVAQAATDRPVKITIPGPLTIIDTTANEAYENERDLAIDLAAALNFEIRALVAAGCRYIQVDEPVFARRVDDALDFGVESLARCFEGVPSSVTRVMHMCCGYPGHLDDEDYPKADVDSYFKLARELDDCGVDQVSLEHAHRANDLFLLELFKRTSVILGAIDVARSRIEPIEEIRLLLEKALNHIDADRLIAAPDCGLILLDRDTAMAKLRNMCAAAKAV
jgi:5-methyltetrahydropteroyltriglutamate--homocysteine methyltransferase